MSIKTNEIYLTIKINGRRLNPSKAPNFSIITSQCHLPSPTTFTTHFNPNSSSYSPSPPLLYSAPFTPLKLWKSTIDNARLLRYPTQLSHPSQWEKREKIERNGEGTYRKKIIFFIVMEKKSDQTLPLICCSSRTESPEFLSLRFLKYSW